MKIDPHTVQKTAAAVISGLLLTGAFPKIDAAWLAWIALVPLLWAVCGARPAQAFRLGFIAGLAHYLSLIYWVVPTMRIYGQLPLYICLPVLFLFSTYLALYTGCFGWLAAVCCRGSGLRRFWLPVFWVALELVRSVLFTGFPWELLGYTQYRVLPLIQIADLVGVYGVSFMVVLCNAAIFQIVFCMRPPNNPNRAAARQAAVALVVACSGLAAGAWFYGNARLADVDRQLAAAPTHRLTVVQGNIAQDVKWAPAFQIATIERYLGLSAAAMAEAPALIIWPETAVPFHFLYNGPMTEKVLDGIRDAGTDFLVGSNAVVTGGSGPAYYNSAFLITADGTVTGRYDKAHLVPFGEYVPLKRWLPFVGKMVEHVGDFQAGRTGDTLPWLTERLGVLICYEIIFPNLARRLVANGASVLVNMTNDAWYGRSSAPYQHFSMAVFRAVENRRPLVRSANTGISGFIDPAGRITAATALFQSAAVTRPVPVFREKTAYTRFGDRFAWACLALTIGAIFFSVTRRFR